MFDKLNIDMKIVKIFAFSFISLLLALLIIQNKSLKFERNTYREKSIIYEHQISDLVENVKKEQEFSAKASHQIDEMIEVIKDDHKLVNDPRLEKLYDKKPGLVIDRINNASERMRHELEESIKK